MDEGSISDDIKYQSYFLRFMDIFERLPEVESYIYIPGDNDIGGEGSEMVKPSKVRRFKSFFENMDKWKFKDHHFNIYHVNRITHEMPLLAESEEHEVLENSEITRIFISHFSMVHAPGAFSYKAIETFKPHIIFSGHLHRSAQISSELSQLRYSRTLPLTTSMIYDLNSIEGNQEVVEIQVPTCSYRMGEGLIGYGMAVFENGYLHYQPLFIPNRFQQLKMYVAFAIILIIINILISRRFRMCLRYFKLLRQNYEPI